MKICHCRVLYSSLAQSVEHSAVNRVVVGSSPTGGAIMSGQKPNCRKTSILSGFFVFFGANFKLKFRRPIFGESLYLADSNRRNKNFSCKRSSFHLIKVQLWLKVSQQDSNRWDVKIEYAAAKTEFSDKESERESKRKFGLFLSAFPVYCHLHIKY